MKRALLLAACLGGCFDPQYDNPTCGPAGECPSGLTCEGGVCRSMTTGDIDASRLDDAHPDARPLLDAPLLVDAPVVPDALQGCASWSFTPSNVSCSDPTGGNLSIAGRVTFNTDSGTFSNAMVVPSVSIAQGLNEPELRVLDVSSLDIPSGAELILQGSASLVILVHGTATIHGLINAAATGSIAGSGAQVVCNVNTAGGQGLPGSGSGGGGGGAYQFPGGRGGNGSSGGGGGGALGGGGGALSPLHGGCFGGQGGLSNGQLSNPGAAGGAVQISARDAIVLTGTIDASGGGGGGGLTAGSGGGGGGSGGGILLESPTINLASGSLCADGGAGGEGGAFSESTVGFVGGDAHCGGVAVGGAGNSSGGDGGNGGWNGSAAFNGNDIVICTGGCGGGGGGGGSGVIRLRGTTSGAPNIVTPAPNNVAL